MIRAMRVPWPVIWIVTKLPTATSPKLHVTIPLWFVQLPWLALALLNEKPLGNWSVTVNACASCGPRLLTASVYVNGCPTGTGSCDSVIAIDTSVANRTGVSTNAELFVRFKSSCEGVTRAQLLTTPACWGVTTIATDAVAPPSIEPKSHVTWPAALAHCPCEGVADWNITLAGKILVSSMAAPAGPRLVTCKE